MIKLVNMTRKTEAVIKVRRELCGTKSITKKVVYKKVLYNRKRKCYVSAGVGGRIQGLTQIYASHCHKFHSRIKVMKPCVTFSFAL